VASPHALSTGSVGREDIMVRRLLIMIGSSDYEK